MPRPTSIYPAPGFIEPDYSLVKLPRLRQGLFRHTYPFRLREKGKDVVDILGLAHRCRTVRLEPIGDGLLESPLVAEVTWRLTYGDESAEFIPVEAAITRQDQSETTVFKADLVPAANHSVGFKHRGGFEFSIADYKAAQGVYREGPEPVVSVHTVWRDSDMAKGEISHLRLLDKGCPHNTYAVAVAVLHALNMSETFR